MQWSGHSYARAHCSVVLAFCVLTLTGPAFAASAQPPQRSIAAYRDHLQSLASLIAQCRQHTDVAHCNGDAVGPDEQVRVPGLSQPRSVSYVWLRSVLQHVADTKHVLQPAEVAPLLQAAAERIQLEQSQAPGGPSKIAPVAAQPGAAHTALTQILARPEFLYIDRSLLQRVQDQVALWINRHLAGLAEYSSHRRWLGRLLTWALISFACLGLAVWFVQQSRRARGLNLENAAPMEGSPSLRSWERWRQDAEEAVLQQRWRDAVRAYYWASIARLESRGQWTADRARTPREYLRLLVPDHPKHHDLGLLTRQFEGCWYGADKATQPDCDAARRLFERLVTR